MVPVAEKLVSASVTPGDAVLDVACGTGFASRAAATVVGASGRVVGSDLNPGMIAVAQTTPDNSDCGISWRQASALELPFADGEFDAVISQQGVQFFPDTSAGLREMARVTRPGGRVSATVWAPRLQSPYLDAQCQALVEFCGVDPGELRAPFAEAGPSLLEGWFKAAGLEQVEVELMEVTVALPPVREYLPGHMKAMPWAGAFFGLDADTQSKALGFAEDLLTQYRTGSGVDVPFQSFLATAAT
jgi:SAM-dependent methyltransferase